MLGATPREQDVDLPQAEASVQSTSSARRGRRVSSPRAERRWWLSWLAIGVLLVAGAYWAGTKTTSPGALARRAAPAPRTLLTATVALRRLAETLPAHGVIAAANTYEVNLGTITVPGAQPIVTAQAARVGSVISNGSLLTQIAGRPVFAMLGSTPMYRDLTLGDHGADITQLQADLAALGFPSSDGQGVFGIGTRSALNAFYRSAGYSLPLGALSKHPMVVLPQAEVVFVPILPAVLQRSSLVVGRQVSNPALVLADGRLRAAVELTEAQGALVRIGDRATIYISSTNGIKVSAADVATVRTAAPSKGGGPTAILRPRKPLSWATMGSHVTVNILIASTSRAVLAVPVAALYTAADGQAFVTVVAQHRRFNVVVKVGPATGGYVPVQPIQGKLTPGERVLVGE